MSEASAISSLRLRLGVVLILLWMLPFWLLGPYIASLSSASDQDAAAATATAAIMIVQTIIGVAGAYVGGRETATVIKTTPRKQLAGTIWMLLRHGNREQDDVS